MPWAPETNIEQDRTVHREYLEFGYLPRNGRLVAIQKAKVREVVSGRYGEVGGSF
jgi:hypothetical protein